MYSLITLFSQYVNQSNNETMLESGELYLIFVKILVQLISLVITSLE